MSKVTNSAPKRLSAKVILSSMRKAPPGNAIKLTDPNLYVRVDFQNFFSEIPALNDLTDEEKGRLSQLQEEMGYLKLNQFYREDKLYVYFILKLQEILYRGNLE